MGVAIVAGWEKQCGDWTAVQESGVAVNEGDNMIRRATG